MTSVLATPIDIEAAMVQRLKERVLDAGLVRFVYDTREYGAVEEESQLVPALAVIYNGYRPAEVVGHGAVQAVEIEYLVVAIARSSSQALRASGAKDAASEIFDATVKALIGWKPLAGAHRLMLAGAPGAGYTDAGYTYLPIGFTTRITYTPQP